MTTQTALDWCQTRWYFLVQWNLDITNLYVMKSLVKQGMIFSTPVIMRKNFDIMKPCNSKQIFLVPWLFVISRFRCISRLYVWIVQLTLSQQTLLKDEHPTKTHTLSWSLLFFTLIVLLSIRQKSLFHGHLVPVTNVCIWEWVELCNLVSHGVKEFSITCMPFDRLMYLLSAKLWAHRWLVVKSQIWKLPINPLKYVLVKCYIENILVFMHS